jgi:hypothetical protein
MGIVPARHDKAKEEGEVMNEERARAELNALEANLRALEEKKRKLDRETIVKYKRLEARFLAVLQRVQSKLTARG